MDAHYTRHVEGRNLHKPPTFVVPGFAEDASSFEKFANDLSHNNHNVFVTEHPRGKDERQQARERIDATIDQAREWYKQNRPDIDPVHLEALFASLPQSLLEEAMFFIRIIEEEVKTTRKEPVEVVGHSQGAFTVVLAAFLRPDLFPNQENAQSTLLLMNPAGFTGREGIAESKALQAIGKVKESKEAKAREMVDDSWRTLKIMVDYSISQIASFIFRGNTKEAFKQMNEADKKAAGYVARNFLNGRIFQEGSDIANTDIVPFLEVVHGNGVRLAVMSDEKDSLFRSEKIEKRVSGLDYIELYKTDGEGHFLPVRAAKKASDKTHDILTRSGG